MLCEVFQLSPSSFNRGEAAPNIEEATVSIKKEVRGAAGETKEATAARDTAVLAAETKKPYMVEQKLAYSIEAMRNGGECEACQYQQDADPRYTRGVKCSIQ